MFGAQRILRFKHRNRSELPKTQLASHYLRSTKFSTRSSLPSSQQTTFKNSGVLLHPFFSQQRYFSNENNNKQIKKEEEEEERWEKNGFLQTNFNFSVFAALFAFIFAFQAADKIASLRNTCSADEHRAGDDNNDDDDNNNNNDDDDDKKSIAENSDNVDKEKDGNISGGDDDEASNLLFTIENKFGLNKENLPEFSKIRYLIIGGGAASYSAIKAIRSIDKTGHIIVLGGEDRYAYYRPALSKEVWKTDDIDTSESLQFINWLGDLDSLEFKDSIYYNYELENVVYFRNCTALMMNAQKKRVIVDNQIGSVIEFEKCLIATGSSPVSPPFPVSVDAFPLVSSFRSINDFQRLDRITRDLDLKDKTIAVIGSDFLGCELADNLSSRGKRMNFHVIHVFPEPQVLSEAVPHYFGEYVQQKMNERSGVDVQPNSEITQIAFNRDHKKLEIHRTDKPSILVDYAVFSTKTTPNDELASNDLEIDSANGGILCSPELQCRPGIFAAGDVLSFYDLILKKRRRVELFDHAIESGKTAGRNMALSALSPSSSFLTYSYLPLFWSEIAGVEMQGIGDCDASKYKTVGVWMKTPPISFILDPDYQPAYDADADADGHDDSLPHRESEYRKGLIYYVNDDDRIVGILFSGLSNTLKEKLVLARKLITKRRKHKNLLSIQQSIIIEEWSDQDLHLFDAHH